MVEFGTRVRAWEFLPMPNFVKIAYGDKPFWGKFIPKIPILEIFAPVSPDFKATTEKFGVRLRAWDTLPTPNFV